MAPRKRNPEDAKILHYPDSAMRSAIAAVREGRFKIREAGRHFGVPHSTLINKLKGRVPEVRKMGRDTYFTPNEEDLLVKYIIANAKKGIPIKRQTLLETVKKILDDDERVTPFKNNWPGKKWVTLFYNRHPEITEKLAEGISTGRAAVSEKDLQSWHKSLKVFLTEEDALDILEDPERIFNADESGFQTCPESGKVLGPVGMKNFYQIKSGKEKEQLTVMVTINAAGHVVTPMIVYPLVRISKEISSNVPEDWGIGKSPKGWMTGPLYYEYIANILDPWVKKNNIKKPVLLLIDGHRSHLTLQVSQYCAENQIIAYALFPNSTHILQPADVSVFKCMKSGWKNTVSEYKSRTGNRQITRAGFAPLLAKVFEEKVTPEVVSNGFKKCGIYPYNVTAIDMTRCMDSETRRTAPVSPPPQDIGVKTLLLLESFMRRGRVEQFRRSNEIWNGEETAKELFYVWKKFSQHCLCVASPYSSEYVKSPIQDLRSVSKTPPVPDVLFIESNSPLQKHRIASLPEEINTPTRCNTPLLTSPNILLNLITSPGTSPLSKVPDLPVESETSTRCSTPVSLAQDTPQILETPARSWTPPIAKVLDFSQMLKTPTRSCTPPIVTSAKSCTPPIEKAPKMHFVSHPPKVQTNNSGSPSISKKQSLNLMLLSRKQKQISPAFGRHIIWPSDSPIKKSKKERLPFATTSKKWQEYWLSKENEKDEKNKKTEIRKRVREENKAKKNKKAPKKTRKAENETNNRKKLRIITSDTSSSDSEARSDEIPKDETERIVISDEENETNREDKVESANVNSGSFEVGDFVIFDYDGTYFVGQIKSISEEGALIQSMQKSLKNWRWPDKEDIGLYGIGDIKEKIREPKLIHRKRGIYHVSGFEKYTDYI